MTTRRPARIVITALAAFALTACSGGTSAPPGPDDGATMTAAATDPPDEGSGDLTEEVADTQTAPDAAEIPECEEVELTEGATIDGTALGECMALAMMAAGSGSQVVTSSDGVTEVDFEWTPEINVHARGNAEFVIRGDHGWMLLDGQWVQGNPNSSDGLEMMAGAVVELSRAFGDPRAMVLLFHQTSWTVVEHTDVPVSGGVSTSGWHLEAQGPMELFGTSMSPMRLWLGEDYLGIYFEGTASAMGITETSSNLFTQWGEPVDIPDVGP